MSIVVLTRKNVRYTGEIIRYTKMSERRRFHIERGIDTSFEVDRQRDEEVDVASEN